MRPTSPTQSLALATLYYPQLLQIRPDTTFTFDNIHNEILLRNFRIYNEYIQSELTTSNVKEYFITESIGAWFVKVRFTDDSVTDLAKFYFHDYIVKYNAKEDAEYLLSHLQGKA